MSSTTLSPDTQAILLLTGSLGRPRSVPPEPLAPTEYNRLAQRLLARHLRPGDLLQRDGPERLRELGYEPPLADRIAGLLERGGALALVAENWMNKGLWLLGRGDEQYPRRLKERLSHISPPIIYGVGNMALLTGGGLAIVGSRDTDEHGIEFARAAARRCASEDIPVISGGARGVDSEAMQAALAAGGKVIGVLADSLARAAVSGAYRDALRSGQLVLISPFDPSAGFSVGNAMARNKLIYCLSDAALIVSADLGQGGTWAGATENLKHQWVPLFVRVGDQAPEGNVALAKQGGLEFTLSLLEQKADLRSWIRRSSAIASNGQLPGPSTPASEVHRSPAHLAVFGQENAGQTADLFEVVKPCLCAWLTTERTEEEIASHFCLEKAQVKVWLKRLEADGAVTKLKQPVRYIAIPPSRGSRQLSLLT